jgi:2-dehydropantoate 2-reductase
MLGGLLARDAPGDQVLLVVRGAHGDAIQQSGSIELVGPWGTRSQRIAASTDMADIAGSDIVVVTTKSQATEQALADAMPHAGDAVIVSIQNGINDHIYARHVPLDRLVMGMTATNMATASPGRVSLQLDGVTVFGPPVGGQMHAGVDCVTRLFSQIKWPGLSFLSHPNALGMRYNKLIINAIGYASCLSASNFITEALANKAWRRGVGWPLLAECRRVLAEADIKLEPMPGRSDIARVERLMNLFSWPIVGPIARGVLKGRFEKTPIVFSLYQDLLRGKATEVGYINGEIVRLAETVDSTAPVNAEIVRMVRELEQQNRQPPTFFNRQEVINRIREVLR